MLYFIFLFFTGYHFSIFFSLFFPGKSMSPLRLFDLFGALSLSQKILYIFCILISFGIATVITFLTFRFERTLLTSHKKHFLLLCGVDLYFFFLAISPLFFTYENSLLHTLSENENVRFLIIFSCFMSMLLFLLYYHFSQYQQKTEQEHRRICKRMEEENRMLQKQIDEDNTLLSQWKKDIETYSEELSAIDGVPEDAIEYYNAIKNSFLILDSEEKKRYEMQFYCNFR